MAICEECGSRQVGPARIAGYDLERCALCGHHQGDPRALEVLEAAEAADIRGVDALVYPLVEALERVPTFRVDQASPGTPGTSEYPFVFLRVVAGGLKHLERLLTSLEMANRETHRRWVVECSLQHGLLFILRPRFWKPILEIDEHDVREARLDLPILARILARDVELDWWRK